MDSYGWLYAQTRAGRERGPQAARALLDRLGAPDKRFASIRVIGTNGKGSTCAMLDAGLRAAGVRAGRFTSPHLQAFEERVTVAGRQVNPAQVRDFVTWARQQPSAAFFDLTLGLACQVFAQSGVTWAVMEAGVGGRSDATQALSNVRAVAITNVALDHQSALGNSVTDIARDKGGAALAGVPLLTTAEGEALSALTEVSEERGAPLYTPATHPELFALPASPAMSGEHQLRNAALALATLRLLGFEAGAEAALRATYPGRLEEWRVQGRRVLLDGAHNPHAARALARATSRVDTLLFGSLARKDSAATLNELLPLGARLVITSPGEGGADPAQLAPPGALAEPDLGAALDKALQLTPPGGTLLITGSLYLVGAARQRLTSQKQT